MWLASLRRYVSKALFLLLNIILFVFFMRFFILDFGVVSGPSMMPLFMDGEFFLVAKAPLFVRSPQRFEIVQVINSKQPDSLVVKRVVGLPGETIYFRQNKVCVTGPKGQAERCFDEPYLAPQTVTQSRTQTYTQTYIPPDHYYLLGDNRKVSSDSREYGSVPRSHILGLAIKL